RPVYRAVGILLRNFAKLLGGRDDDGSSLVAHCTFSFSVFDSRAAARKPQSAKSPLPKPRPVLSNTTRNVPENNDNSLPGGCQIERHKRFFASRTVRNKPRNELRSARSAHPRPLSLAAPLAEPSQLRG